MRPYSLAALLAISVFAHTHGAELSGLVCDNLRSGIPGIEIRASIPYNGTLTQVLATTDATGAFRITSEPGFWNVEVPIVALNARGFLSVYGRGVDVTDHSRIRFITRKLDFTHRVNGRLLDEVGQPLAGCTLRASIRENNAVYATNMVTSETGAFTFAAFPALWSFSLEAPVPRVFGGKTVEVEVTNTEKQVTFVAPAAPSSIVLTTTNLEEREVILTAEALGATYRLVGQFPFNRDAPSSVEFKVFNGRWTITVADTIAYGGMTHVTLPQPISVTVSNTILKLAVNGTAGPAPVQQPLRVRTITSGGKVLTNVSVSVNSMPRVPRPYPPVPNPGTTPGVFDLTVPPGSARVSATTGTPPWTGCTISREVNISTNEPQSEVTLVFPEEETAPRILGAIKTPTGASIPPRAVYIRMQAGETNYQVNAVSDTNGSYSARVLPGRWLVTTYNVQQPVSTDVLVSSNDVEVNFEQLLPAPQPSAHLTLRLAGDTEWMEPEPFTLGSAFEWFSTYTDATPFSLRPGVWRASFNPVNYVGGTPEFMLLPSLTFALAPASSTNLVLAVQQTTRRMEGTIRDQDGRLQSTGFAAAWTSVNGTNFWVNGLITSGYFSLNVFPGRWHVGASLTGYPAIGYAENGTPGRPRAPYETAVPTTYSSTPPAIWIEVSNQVARCEFVVTNTPVGTLSPLNVAVLREDGESVAGLDLFTSSLLSIWIDGVTDSNGLARLNVPQGPFTIRAALPSYGFTYEPLLWPNLALSAVPQDQSVVLVVRRPTRCINGTIENVAVFGLQPRILASTVINGTNYFSTGSPDSQGHFCLPAIPGTWTVSVDDEYLNAYGIRSAPKQTVTVTFTRPPDALTFVLTQASEDFRHARLFTPKLLPDSGIELELESVTALNWLFERSGDLTHWTPFTLGYSENGRFVLKDARSHSTPPVFYRTIWAR